MISSRSKLFALIGDPVSHSLSPLLQNYFFKRFGIDGVYLAFRVEKEALPASLLGARAMGFAGFNVTLPHKSAVMPLCDYRSPEADRLGVANTLVLRSGKVHAFTTDHTGFIASLGPERERFGSSRAVLFGAGGSARAVVYALSQLGVSHLAVVSRSQSRTDELTSFCRQHLAFREVIGMTLDHSGLREEMVRASILINATSAGMHPRVDEAPISCFDMISKEHFVYDLVYNPLTTLLMGEARKRGASVQGGLEMLIFQGLASLNLWTYGEYQLDGSEVKKIRNMLVRELK